MKLSKTSLKWKLLLIILTFSALIILVFYIFQILLLDNIYRNTKISQTKLLMDEVYDIVDNADLGSLTNAESSSYNELERLMEDSDINIYIIKQKNDHNITTYPCIFPIEHNQTNVFNSFGFDYIYKTIQNIGDPKYIVLKEKQKPPFNILVTSDKDDLENDNIIYCQRVDIARDSSYLILIYSRVTPVQPVISTLQTQFLYISFIVIILTLVIVFTLSKSISKPITDITVSAKNLAKGDYNIVFNGQGFKEISELSETLNYAAVELKKTEDLQRELLANVSHDLRTPLTLITGYAEMIRDFPGEDSAENVQIIIDEANRLKLLVSDLLVLSRISAKTENFNLTIFNLTSMIESIVNRQQKFVESQNFIISFKFTEKIDIEADMSKMEQVIYNFISNAINYSGESRNIEVIQEIKDNNVIIKIKDYGIGIRKEDLEYVWDRYYRVDKGLQRSTQGTGLGLSIIKGILDYHNFKYGVTSTIGEGSTFWFEAPIKKK